MNKRFRRLLIVPVMLTLVVAGWQLLAYDFSKVAPIEKVEIEGEFENISHDSFREKVMAVIDGGYFSLDLDEVKTDLMSLPWVDDVSVRRQWPSSLHIKVTEKRAVAYWNNDAMISDRGEVFTPELIRDELNLPRLKGPDGLHNKVWLFLTEITKGFSPMGFQVADLSLDERRAWSVHFISEKAVNKIEIKLGRDHADDRLARFVRVFSSVKQFDLKNIEVIDLRYPNGFAMRIKNNIASKHALVMEV